MDYNKTQLLQVIFKNVVFNRLIPDFDFVEKHVAIVWEDHSIICKNKDLIIFDENITITMHWLLILLKSKFKTEQLNNIITIY